MLSSLRSSILELQGLTSFLKARAFSGPVFSFLAQLLAATPTAAPSSSLPSPPSSSSSLGRDQMDTPPESDSNANNDDTTTVSSSSPSSISSSPVYAFLSAFFLLPSMNGWWLSHGSMLVQLLQLLRSASATAADDDEDDEEKDDPLQSPVRFTAAHVLILAVLRRFPKHLSIFLQTVQFPFGPFDLLACIIRLSILFAIAAFSSQCDLLFYLCFLFP